MQLSKLLGLLAPSFFVFACGSTALLDGSDDMRPAGASGSQQTYGNCSNCFQTSCPWQTAQCEGDPGCATWLAEVKACPADASQQLTASCVDKVSFPDSASGKLAAAALKSCVTSSGACCAESNSKEIGGAAGAGGPSAADASVSQGDSADGPDASSNSPDVGVPGIDTPTHDDPSCQVCIEEFKHNASDKTCGQAARDCYGDGASDGCRTFMYGYFEHCVPAVASLSDASAVSQCMLNYANNTSSDAQVMFMSRVLACTRSACGSSCLPKARRDCMACQQAACPDVYEAYLNDADAQKLLWCRDAAKGESSALEKCDLDYSAGKPVLKVMAQCSQTSCSECK